MKYHISFFLLLIFHSIGLYGQNLATNWHFGCGAGITFNNGEPEVIPSSIRTREGVASISNKCGDLLFYSDGRNLYNNDGNLVESNLLGDPSSTSSILIIPKTGQNSEGIYFLFTVDFVGGDNGLNYYEYDSVNETIIAPSLNIVSSKNELLHTEKISAVKRQARVGHWFSTILRNGDIYVYRVDSVVALLHEIETDLTLDNRNSTGHLKFSSDGKYLACTLPSDPSGSLSYRGTVNIYDFDNSTGEVKNPKNPVILDFTTNGAGQPYGLEFSPTQSYIYVSLIIDENRNQNGGSLYQFDLDAANIQSSKTLIARASRRNMSYGSLQLAPDGKIYLAMEDGNETTSSCGCYEPHRFLGVINDPDMISGSVGFIEDGLDLQTNSISDECSYSSGGGVKLGLPTFISSSILPSGPLTTVENDYTCATKGSANIEADSECSMNFTFDWSTGFSEQNSSTSNIDNLDEGKYSVTTTDDNGLVTIDSFVIAANENNFPIEVILEKNDSSTLSPQLVDIEESDIISISWTPAIDLSCTDCLFPIVKPSESTEYILEIETSAGCIATLFFNVRLLPSNVAYAPTIFTPSNKDGLNDIFFIQGDEEVVEIINTLSIYDRWGNLIFTKKAIAPNDRSQGWNGTFDGKKMDSGVYVYLLDINFENGENKKISGTVNLLR